MVNDRLDKLRMELRRGTLVFAVILALQEEEYGYSLRRKMDSVGLKVDESTLYPLIRRLESQGLLTSNWRESSEGRRRRYYQTSSEGIEILKALRQDWDAIQSSIETLNRS